MPQPRNDRAWLFPGALAAVALPLLHGALFPGDWTWGFDHLSRVGPVVAGALALLTLLALFPRPACGIARGAAWIGRRMEARPWPSSILAALLATAAFAAFPIATRIYGDSLFIIQDYRPENLPVHLEKLGSFGLQSRGAASFVLHESLAALTGLSYERCYMLVSVICGTLFVLAHARFAATLPEVTSWIRAAILWLGLTDAGNQLFFGHVENYSLPRLFSSLFFMAAVRAALDPSAKRRLLFPAIWLLLGVFFHAQLLILLPALACLVVRRAPAGLIILGSILLLAILYVATGALCYDYIYSGGRPHLRQLFLPLRTDCVGEPYLRYTLFSSAHLTDFLGSIFSLVSPAVLFLLLLLAPRKGRDPRIRILWPTIALALLHNFVLNPAIGFPFDWDLMTVLSPPLLYAACLLLAIDGAEPRRVCGAIAVLGVVAVLLFGINASSAHVYRRVEEMGLWLHRSYYGGSHYRLSANLSTIVDPGAQAAERERVLHLLEEQTYPDDREVAFLWERLAQLRIDQGDYLAALSAFSKALAVEPSRWDRKKAVGYLETEVGDPRRGVRLLTEYLEMAPRDAEGWLLLGDGEEALGGSGEAIRSWRRFLELDPASDEAGRVRAAIDRLGRSSGPLRAASGQNVPR